jgi:tetratricopeptide (TPR) repeat protein
MTSISQGGDFTSCMEVRSLFDKTIVEDILSPEEQRRVDMHLARCPQCQRLFALTSALPSFVNKSETRFDAAIAAVMEDLRRKREEKQTLRTKWIPLAMAGAVAALVVVGAWALQDVPRSSPVTTPELPCVPKSPIETASGVLMAYCNNDRPKVRIDRDEIRVILDRGAAAFSVDPERPEKKSVVVETAFGEARVKGTLFAVHVKNDNAWVEVVRGVVEVVPKGKEDLSFSIAAGSGSELKQRSTFRVSEPVRDMVVQALSVAPSNISQPISPDMLLKSDRAETESTIEIYDNDNPEVIEKEIHGRIREGSHGHTTSAIKALIKEARACLLVRDWKCAASRYQDALRINSRRPGLTTVLISLAKIELRHLNLPKRALDHYETYLRQAPNGPLAEEAFLGMANSYQRLGLKKREEETLRRFIARYPESNMSKKARARLKQLNTTASF